ncbi:flagellar protein FliT [Bacillus rubiinfantis]|uniref:flagellar protein FliT n=1 Tax=Bacillus rubiinfantis TaxID=1499680 RepID=UPI0005A714CF|nr:flagellar protein FliT [Bacillus rubiinfantis]
MINELIQSIYNLTITIKQALLAEKEEELSQLLQEREQLMEKVMAQKSTVPNFHYSSEAEQMMRDTLELDQEIKILVETALVKTKKELQKLKLNKQVSQLYRPYYKQTSGAFIDSKK